MHSRHGETRAAERSDVLTHPRHNRLTVGQSGGGHIPLLICDYHNWPASS